MASQAHEQLRRIVDEAGGLINLHAPGGGQRHITVRLPDINATVTAQADSLDAAAKEALELVEELIG